MLLLLIRGLEKEGGEKLPGIEIDDPTRKGKIRCPRCAYRPKASDRWQCDCGFTWNTFDTHGVCPACDHAWMETACPACHLWSAHEAWYER